MHLHRIPLLAAAALVAASLSAPTTAEAQRSPSVRAVRVQGDAGIRPFIGTWGDLDVDDDIGAEPLTGNKFVWGIDLLLGPGTGLNWVLGAHLGAGNGDFALQPLIEAHYRFATSLRLVPWVGGGASLKLGFGNNEDFNLAVTFRLVAGVEWWITPDIAVSTQLALPDIGPRFLPSVEPIGTVEWIIGPHIRI